MGILVASVFLSAFLLFQIQPMIGHYILPWFGGTNSVWSAVMLFFQVVLTAGYAYAYWLIGRVPSRKQWRLHGALLVFSLLVMLVLGIFWPSPVTPGASWKPADASLPILRIFLILLVSIGLPYFILTSNSPIMQSWFARLYPGRSPYWLYALSNAGSLLGLLSYPLVVEPTLVLRRQGWLWAAGYVLFTALAGYVTWRARRAVDIGQGKEATARQASTVTARPSASRQILWLALSAVATGMLLAVTSRLTQELAPIPLLWVLPLTVYLLSFVVAFSGERWYQRSWFSLLLTATSIGVVVLTLKPLTPILWQIGVYLLFLFAVCMMAHGELYRLRPGVEHLTRFYLLVSLGGATGGLLVNFLAPVIFNDYWEFYAGWVAACLLLTMLTFVRRTELSARWRFWHDSMVGALAVGVTIFSVYAMVQSASADIWRKRNFYGVLVVRENPQQGVILLAHGATVHGIQFTAAERRNEPCGYYWSESGIGLALTSHPRYGKGMRVGILGLGIGGLTAYGQAGDVYRFYEINPLVVELANGQGGFFSYLNDGRERGVQVDIVTGDARLSLERELQQGGSQGYDMLIVDVFNSDSIPVHLLTREAVALYLEHLAPDGVLAIHISNRYLDLRPVVWQAARQFGLEVAIVATPAAPDRPGILPSVWALLTRDESLFVAPSLAARLDRLEHFTTKIRPWSDDYSNIFQLLR